MGYDAFGLPAENHAIKTGEHPRDVDRDVDRRVPARSSARWGISIDWSREFGTHEPRYYRWTQWIFLQLFERGLAYRKEAAVNWCPNDQTVLANEQVIDGRCERCGDAGRGAPARAVVLPDHRLRRPAAGRPRRRSTGPSTSRRCSATGSAAPRAPRSRSRCAEVGIDYPVFTPARTRCSARRSSCMAPEHPDVLSAWPRARSTSTAVREYVNRALTESSEERGDVEREKTGVPLGRTVTNPVNGERIPMYVADYVLMEYGTGAIMAVPGHDQRDYEFAHEVRPARSAA